MEIKTLAYLNSKIWYRFIKVLFVVSLLILLAIFNFIVFSGGVKQVDQTQTIIQCNSKGKTFTAQSIGLDLSSSDFTDGQFNYRKFFEGYNDYSIGKIVTACFPKSDTSDIYDNQKEMEIASKLGLFGFTAGQTVPQSLMDTYFADYNAYKKETSSMFGNQKTQYLDFSFHMFDITPAYTFNKFLELFCIGNIIILLIFEIIRRVFYYIALGTFRPKKTN